MNGKETAGLAALPDREPPPATPAARRAWPGWVKGFLWADLLLCGIVALNSVLSLWLWRSAEPGSTDAFQALVEGSIGSGIALFGLIGNGLLLRGRRAGLIPAFAALGCVAAGIAAAYVVMARKLSQPELLTCLPEDLISGIILGTFLRACYNFLYALALGWIARHHRPDALAG